MLVHEGAGNEDVTEPISQPEGELDRVELPRRVIYQCEPEFRVRGVCKSGVVTGGHWPGEPGRASIVLDGGGTRPRDEGRDATCEKRNFGDEAGMRLEETRLHAGRSSVLK